MNIDKNKFLLAMARGKFSVNSLSALSGIGRVTLSKLKSGRAVKLQPETLGKLAAALNVDVTELLQDQTTYSVRGKEI